MSADRAKRVESLIPGVDSLPTIDQLPPPGYERMRVRELKKISKETGIPVDEIERLEQMSDEDAAKNNSPEGQ